MLRSTYSADFEANSPSPALNAVYCIDWVQRLAGLPRVSHPIVSSMNCPRQTNFVTSPSKGGGGTCSHDPLIFLDFIPCSPLIKPLVQSLNSPFFPPQERLSFRPPGFSPYMGREERRVQGLDYKTPCSQKCFKLMFP